MNVHQPRLEHRVLTHHNVDSPRSSSTRIRLLAGVVAALLVAGAPVAGFMITPAHAQASISVEGGGQQIDVGSLKDNPR
jgi:hypothetical protein